MDWYLKVLKNYVGFRGRARRKEYWMFILVNIIFTFVLGLLENGHVVLSDTGDALLANEAVRSAYLGG